MASEPQPHSPIPRAWFHRLRDLIRYWPARRWLLALGLGSLLTALTVGGLLSSAGTTYLHLEAHSEVAALMVTSGRPIGWSLDGGSLIECSALLDGAAGGANRGPSAVLLASDLIELNAESDTGSMPRRALEVRVAIDGDDVVVELESPATISNPPVAALGQCATEPDRLAVLVSDTGARRGLRLPALIRLPGKALGNGLTLEFRGALGLGQDVTSSRQPLLLNGKLALREVRDPWLQRWVTNPQFEVESRELGLGDKVKLANPAGAQDSTNAPQGFLRLTRGERGPEMRVQAIALAAQAEIVRPFGRPETPRPNRLKVASRDDVLLVMGGVLVAFWTLGLALYPLLPVGRVHVAQGGSADHRE